MKIIIPTDDKKGLDGKIAKHFGRCLTYTFLNEKGKVTEIIDNTSEHMGGAGLPPELMKKHGADILLCQDLGLRAIALCQKLKIKVYYIKKEQANTVKEAFQLWQKNKLKKASAEDACQKHKT